MFKVIADYDDPTSIRTYSNYLDIFNPLNTVHRVPTIRKLIDALKILWNRESILAHPAAFFNVVDPESDRPAFDSPEYSAFIKRLIKPVPDDKLYLFHWLYFRKINSDNKIVYVRSDFTDPRLIRNKFHCYVNPSSYITATYSYRGDNYADEINSVIDLIEANLTRAIGDRWDSHLHPELVTPAYYNSVLSVQYQRLVQDVLVYSSSDYLAYTVSQLRQLMLADPSINLTDSGHYCCSFTVNQVISKANKKPLYRQYSYSTNPLAILPWPLTLKGEHNPVLYGVELELSTNYQVKDLIDATDEPFFLCKQDSSISGTKRFQQELVTVPMSFKAHKKQWAYWFSNLDYEQFDTTKNTNNGMHVHIAKKSFNGPTHIKNFIWFFTQPAHFDFMKFYSMRDNYSFSAYSAIPQISNRSTRVAAFQSQERRLRDARGCINFSNKNTLEVRLFRGIVSLADLIKNLEFVDSVYHYTLQGQNFTKMSLKEYVTWLHAQPKNKYTIIKKYLMQTPKLKKLIDGAAILDLIFLETDPAKVIAIVEKTKFPITNAHLTVLNQRWKKRLLLLKDGKLIGNPDLLPALSTLDRLLEQRILGKLKKGEFPTVRPTIAPIPPPLPDPIEESDDYNDDFFDEEAA